MRSREISSKKKQIISYREVKVKQYLSMYLVAAQSFDKAILSLSTASLGFTFAFLNFIQKNNLIYKWLLELSWVGFIFAIIFVILALIFTEKFALHRQKYHSYKILRLKIKIKLKHCRDSWMGRFQVMSAICFIGALIFFNLFVWFNL